VKAERKFLSVQKFSVGLCPTPFHFFVSRECVRKAFLSGFQVKSAYGEGEAPAEPKAREGEAPAEPRISANREMGKSAGREKGCPPMNWWATM